MVTEQTWPVAYSPDVEEKVRKFVKFGALVGIKVEPFQEQIVREIFSGREEVVVLLPRGNGKTALMSLVSLHHLCTHPSPKVYVAANARHQAKLLWDETKRLHDLLPNAVKKNIEPKWNELVTKKGFMRIVSADAMTAQGLDPTLAFYDELHGSRDGKLYTAMKLALKKPEACLCTISSAGYEETGTLGELRKEFLREPDQFHEGRLTFVYKEASASSMFEWAISDDDDYKDISVVKMANPASFVTEERLRRRLNAPGVKLPDFLIFHCGRWAKIGNQDWLPKGAWKACYEEGATIPLSSTVVLGVDIGLKRDSSAVVLLHRREDSHVVVKAKIWTPVGDGTAIDGSLIMQHIRDLCDLYVVTDVAFDPWAFKIPAQLLEAEGIPMREFPMSNVRTIPATTTLMEGIESTVIVHDGDPELTAHVEGGKLVPAERGLRLSKKSKHQIDALMAMLMGYEFIAAPSSSYEEHGLRFFSLEDDADEGLSPF